MDLAALRSWVRTQSLVSTDEVSDSELDDYINAGLRQVGTLHYWPFLQSEDSFSLTAGTDAYALPSDLGKGIEVIIGDEGTELLETTRRSAQRRYLGESDGTPQEYYVWAEQIHLAPTPSSSSEISDVVVDYYAAPTELSADADTPEFHDGFHVHLAEYAASKAWEFLEDFQRANFYYAKFRQGIREMMGFYDNRVKDAPLVVGGGLGGRNRHPMRWLDALSP